MADEIVTFLVALADPTRSLHDPESGWSIKGDYVALCSDPFPSDRVRQWFMRGAIVAVDPADVRFFYDRKELEGLQKEKDLVPIANDWNVPLVDDQGKEKNKARLIEDLVAIMGTG